MTNATTEAMKEDDAALRLSSVANVEGASGKVVFAMFIRENIATGQVP